MSLSSASRLFRRWCWLYAWMRPAVAVEAASAVSISCVLCEWRSISTKEATRRGPKVGSRWDVKSQMSVIVKFQKGNCWSTSSSKFRTGTQVYNILRQTVSSVLQVVVYTPSSFSVLSITKDDDKVEYRPRRSASSLSDLHIFHPRVRAMLAFWGAEVARTERTPCTGHRATVL